MSSPAQASAAKDQAASPLAQLSCYIRTHNEERLIGRVIEAAGKVAGEIILVDSGSTDRTIEIAERAGCKVVRQQWLGWGFQKRVGEDHCSNDWLIDIDADEIVSAELADEIKGLFSGSGPALPVYRLRLVTAPPVGKPWTNFRIDPRAKLYDRRRVRMPADRAWDQLRIEDGLQAGELKGALWHHSFRDIAHLVEKYNRGSSSMAGDSKRKHPAVIRLRVLFAMPFYFFKAYVTRGLWRAGLYGLILARLSAIGRWLRDAKMYELERMEAEVGEPKHRDQG
jgi:glycosyltransferase involved in cell wall biosynthesis